MPLHPDSHLLSALMRTQAGRIRRPFRAGSCIAQAGSSLADAAPGIVDNAADVSGYAYAPPVLPVEEQVEELFDGTIIPLGSVPDGIAWTGFVSVLAFRELNPAPGCLLAVPGFAARTGVKCAMLAGYGSACRDDAALYVTTENQLGWALLRLCA